MLFYFVKKITYNFFINFKFTNFETINNIDYKYDIIEKILKKNRVISKVFEQQTLIFNDNNKSLSKFSTIKICR